MSRISCRRHGMQLFFLLSALLLGACDSSQRRTNAEFDLNDRIDDTELLQHQPRQEKDNIFYFGFDLRASPQEDARQYLPFLQYLETATGYRFRLHFTPKNSNIVEELGNNRVQFAALGAASFLQLQARYGAIPLVRGINSEGKAEYRSVFVVRPESGIKTIKDIKGKRLAFGSRLSTQGYLIPCIILAKHGIGLDELAFYDFTGSHQNCADAVVSGKFDVCGMQDTMGRNMEQQGLLRIIYTSDYYPSSGIATNKAVPARVRARVKQALLEFDPQGKHNPTLYHWERTEMPLGFVAAKRDDYRELRYWMIKLGLIQDDKKRETLP